MDRKTIAAGAFKQGCLSLLDQVAKEHIEVVVTKRGKPVAKVVPIESAWDRETSILGQLRGKARVLVSEEDFIEPSARDAGWKLV